MKAWLERLTHLESIVAAMTDRKNFQKYSTGRQNRRIVMKGENIIAIRKILNLKQADFARLLGIPPSMLCKWEHDQVKPSRKSIQRLAEFRSFGRRDVAERLKQLEEDLYK